jgi:hypothetical protein
MKKYIPVLVVIVLVFSVIGIAGAHPAWASPKPAAGQKAPLLTLKTITETSLSNIGGVCTVDVKFKTTGNMVKADAEVPIEESKLVPFTATDGSNLLFPGCHLVFYKADKIVSPVNTDDTNLKICFGASAYLQMGIYYYLDTPASGSRVWVRLPSTLEDSGRLVCTQAVFTGVYMPTGRIVPPEGTGAAGTNPFFPNGWGGTVLPPPANITITGSGTYAVGGICIIRAKYLVSGLSDTVQVEYPNKHYTEDTLTVPFDEYINGNLFFFPGCHVVHFKDQKIMDQMNTNAPKDGEWQICFAAIPGKTMTIFYYDDNLTKIQAPWHPLVTETANGMSCAGLVDFSAVYAPAGK